MSYDVPQNICIGIYAFRYFTFVDLLILFIRDFNYPYLFTDITRNIYSSYSYHLLPYLRKHYKEFHLLYDTFDSHVTCRK